jgi:hypothetical protein
LQYASLNQYPLEAELTLALALALALSNKSGL